MIRFMQEQDIPKLTDMRPGFVSDTVLKVEKTGAGYLTGWQLVEVKLDQPYDKGRGYDFDRNERESIAKRLADSDSLEKVVIDNTSGQIVGVLDVATESWRKVAWIWNIMLDVDVRGQGLGRELIQQCITWAREKDLRAIMLETQTNNAPACKFYQAMAFELVGINDVFYTNRDLERDEVALFWSYRLK
jgi:ribosomal protein S18 acetylase RimI-like enzyme